MSKCSLIYSICSILAIATCCSSEVEEISRETVDEAVIRVYDEDLNKVEVKSVLVDGEGVFSDTLKIDSGAIYTADWLIFDNDNDEQPNLHLEVVERSEDFAFVYTSLGNQTDIIYGDADKNNETLGLKIQLRKNTALPDSIRCALYKVDNKSNMSSAPLVFSTKLFLK